MQVNLETLSALERRLSIAVPFGDIENEVQTRLKRYARTARIQGFRPGKAPIKLVEQQYGFQLREEVLNETVQRSFGTVVEQQQLKVAGYPRFEAAANDGESAEFFKFNAVFEVYPEVKIKPLADTKLERPQAEVTDAEVEKTIEILRKQRTRFDHVERASQAGDRLVIDFAGTLDGVPFEGGQGSNFALILGQGQMLPEFETNITGLKAEESKTFPLTFPADYHAENLAGKTVEFTVTVKNVSEPQLPALDAAFAKTLGIEDGDLDKLQAEVKKNVEREVSRRLKLRLKENVMQALTSVVDFEVPKALVALEMGRLVEQAQEEFKNRGVDFRNMPFPREMFEQQALRRTTLGLILSDLVKTQQLEAKPEQVRALVEEMAASYEDPAEVVAWYYADPSRLSAPESVAVEDNVVTWVLSQVTVEDKAVAFEELMGNY